MAIEVKCDCGALFQAKDEWAGRRAKCPKCGRVLTVPDRQAALPPVPGGLEDLLDEEVSPQLTAPAAPLPSPTATRRARPKSGGGFLGRLLKKLPGFRDVVFRWREPRGCRVRLRGDLFRRLGTALGVLLALAGVMLFVQAGMDNLGEAIAAGVVLGLFLGFLPAVIVLFFSRKHASGSITVKKDEIYRYRTYAALSSSGSWWEHTRWPYEAIRRAVIVPRQSVGKPFSVLLLTTESRTDIIAIPNKIDLGELHGHLQHVAVPVEYGQSVPERFTRPLDVRVLAVAAVVGAACFIGGLVTYASLAGVVAPQQADEEAVDEEDVDRDQLDEIRKQMEDDFHPDFGPFGPGRERRPDFPRP